MKNSIVEKNNRSEKYKCKPPDVFSIPLDVYKDELEKYRDKASFQKLKKLERNCDQLRQKLHVYSTQQMVRVEFTKYLILRSLYFKNRQHVQG